MTNEERQHFYQCCLKTTVKLAEWLTEFEEKVEQHIDLPDGVQPSVCVSASLLMVVMGMLADQHEGKPDLLRAAKLLGAERHPMREEIRKAMDEVLDAMSIVFTNYLYN
jgi:hypothetical protein